jgi:hypothetical protein
MCRCCAEYLQKRLEKQAKNQVSAEQTGSDGDAGKDIKAEPVCKAARACGPVLVMFCLKCPSSLAPLVSESYHDVMQSPEHSKHLCCTRHSGAR